MGQKICRNCNEIFVKNLRFSKKQWDAALYCSRKCSANVNGKKLIGKKHTEEHRRHSSEALKKVVHTKEWNKKIGLANRGKVISEETRRKMSLSMKGRPAWNKGVKVDKQKYPKMGHYRKHSEDTKKKMSENSYAWKGDEAGYSSIHKWIRRWKGSAEHCDVCGIKGKRYEWSNVDHKYRRVLDDYIPMCASCHRNYDKNNEKRTKL